MRELPRHLTAEQLGELFEGRTRLVELLAERDDPLGDAAQEVIAALPEEDKLAALAAHPAIGASRDTLSERSRREQGEEHDPAAETELAYLNQVYEEKFGFRFVVFVNRRPKSAIVRILQERLARARDEELDTALHELVAIARDRWQNA